VSRSPEQIQREIEASRRELAVTLDQLAEKTSPKRLADVGKQRAIGLAQTPAGMSVLGAVALLVVLGVARKVRNARRS
jgi:Protein of unknown function (DUF3618)